VFVISLLPLTSLEKVAEGGVVDASLRFAGRGWGGGKNQFFDLVVGEEDIRATIRGRIKGCRSGAETSSSVGAHADDDVAVS
jgi:hypothetical protein